MKRKNAGRVIILMAFIIIICLSKGIWFFAEKYLDTENYENRQMASRPQLTLDSYQSFPEDYSSYFNDSLQFRNILISLNSGVDYFCFKRSSNDYVIVGEDNWLFYSRKDDGDPVSCYQGTNLYTDEELAEITHNCLAQRDFLLTQGKEFVIFIAPNKERVYSEYMPVEYGKPAENYGVIQLYNYMKQNTDLRVVYPYEEIMEVKEKIDENLYYKTDTHWNYIGGYVGASALMRELGIQMPSVIDSEITIVKGDETAGDLARMLNLSKQLKSTDYEYTIKGYDLHGRKELESDFLGMTKCHAYNADTRKIYVIRDSFSTAMIPYIGSQFSDSYFRHEGSYNYDDLVSCDPDIVVYELVERGEGRLSYFSVM